MTSYRSILKQAFVTAWEHKYLWFFGLFATLLASNFEIELVNRFTVSSGATPYDWQRWVDTGIFSPQVWSNLMEVARTDAWSFVTFVGVVIILLLLTAGLIWISIVSQIALVSNSNKAIAAGRRLTAAERKHDMSIGFAEGRTHFWPVLWLNAAVRVVVYGLALATLIPTAAHIATGLVGSLVYLVIFIVLLAIALALALIAKYAIAYIIIKRRPAREAVADAWKLFWSNWLASLEMAFILFALSMVASLAIIIAVMVLAIPLAVLYIATVAVGSIVLFVAMLVIAILSSVSVVVIGGSILTVVQTTAWVDFFNQLTTGKVESKLEKVFNR